MQIRVRLFGSLREAVGAKELPMEVEPGTTLEGLRDELGEVHPPFQELGARVRASVNRVFAEDDTLLAEGDEVAFLPPVSGGSGRCTLSAHPLDEREVAGRVRGSDAGGVVTFVGAVRDRSRGHSIRHLEYEAYEEMAVEEMERIVRAAAERWPGTRLAIAHRVGHLEIGEAAVVVAAAAPHRAEAFDACRFAIDSLKQSVPIWKKEVATDGAYWVDDHA